MQGVLYLLARTHAGVHLFEQISGPELFAKALLRAQCLRISPLALGASIRITDSLREGTSRFYAEITRLKQLVTMTDGPMPLMFLLDERFTAPTPTIAGSAPKQ